MRSTAGLDPGRRSRPAGSARLPEPARAAGRGRGAGPGGARARPIGFVDRSVNTDKTKHVVRRKRMDEERGRRKREGGGERG